MKKNKETESQQKCRQKYKKEILSICKKKHLTAQEIFLQLQKKIPQSGVATVYRTIKKLCEENKLNKISGPKDIFLYETNEILHGHILDQKNTIKDFDISDKFIEEIEKKVGSKIKSLDLKVYI